MKDILSSIVADKRAEIAALKERVTVDELYRNAVEHKTLSLRDALLASSSGIIAEFKRRSPSKGWINSGAEPSAVVPGYVNGGAAALSVLTDKKYFGGTLDDVRCARQLAPIPILRKDFTVDEYQLHQARAAGADAVLLIASALTPENCARLAAAAHELGLETLLEIHSEQELAYIGNDIDVIGVNNRNLGTFVTDTSNSERLAAKLPRNAVRISESGLNGAAAIVKLRRLGYNGFLIGEAFMRDSNPGASLAGLVAAVEAAGANSPEP